MRHSLSGSITAVALALLTLPAMCLAMSADEIMELSLEELTKVIITSSTLTEETLQTVPSSMTVYTRADIRRMGLHSLAELANYVPGYQSYRSDYNSTNRSISSRGRALSNNGSEILVLIDGQRLNNDWSGGAGGVESLVSLENIDRVEFIRGPGSAIYGSNAMTGAINIVTRSKRELLLETGSDQRRHASLQWHAEGKAGNAEVFASHASSEGEALNLFSPTSPNHVDSHDPYRADDAYLRAELGEFSLAARATSRDMQEFYVAGVPDQRSNYFDTRTDSLNLGWIHDLSTALSNGISDGVSIEGHVFNSHKSFQLRTALSASGLTLIEGGIEEQELGTQWLLQGGQKKIRWLLGWEWRNPELTDTSAHVGTLSNPTAIIPLLPQAPENGRYINSAFGQLQAVVNNTLTLTTGLRIDDYSDFGNHISPRLALVQQLGAHDTVKALYSEAFRAPTRSESSVINSGALEQNPDLQPETAKTTELIWLHLLDAGVFATTLFNTQVKDAIVEAVVNVPPLKRQPVNGDLSVAGLELEWQQHWNTAWQSRIAFTHIFDAVGDMHTQASTLFGGSLSYEKNAWTATLLANYQGRSRDPNEQDVPANITTTESTDFTGHTVYGAHIAYRVLAKLDLYLNADNLLDKHYLSPATRPANYVGTPGTGRILMAGLRWSFD